ncbi:metal ABC transporter permease [bacterium]|nr:metal ABC transporter permease [bacterium]
MFEAISLGFMQRALAAGVITAVIAGYYGVFVVQRGMSFIGSGLAHAAFGGVALALLLGGEPLWIAVPFTVIVALLITWVRDRTTLSLDAVIGVFFATAMALGILFISRIPTYTTDAFTYLFGSVLSVTWTDLWAVLAVGVIAAATLLLWGRWAYATIDREAAMADRLPVRLDDYILSVLIAVTIVVAAKVVGIVLVSAFLVIPAASARLVSRRFLGMTVISLVLGAGTAVVGLFASYYFDAPSGATIILTQTAAFLVCLLGHALAGRLAGAPRSNSS